MSASSRPLSRGAAGLAVAAVLIVPAAACRPGTTPPTTRTTVPTPTTAGPTTTRPTGQPTVAADGSGRYRTVQAAVDASPANARITIAPGTYRGLVRIPVGKAGISLVGTTGRATDVVLTEGRHAESAGNNENSSTVVNGAANTTIADLTIANTFDRNATSSNQDQALALTARNDKQIYRNVRLLGHQDTFMTIVGSSTTGRSRQLFSRSYIEGDVDFIFGGGTAVFEDSEIHSLARSGGTVMAPATSSSNPYGFLFLRSRFTGSGTNTTYLGRPWHPNNDPNFDGQATIRESTLGAHIRTAQPWTDMSGFSWRTDGRFSEYRNTGPGAGVNGNRPQLSDAQAANTYTRARYLAGNDGWNPA